MLFGLAPSGVALNKIRLLRIISPVCVNSRSFDTRFQTNILSHHQRQHRSTNERARARQETERQLLLCDIAIAFVAIIRRQHSAVKCHRLHASSRSDSKQSAEKARNSSASLALTHARVEPCGLMQYCPSQRESDDDTHRNKMLLLNPPSGSFDVKR